MDAREIIQLETRLLSEVRKLINAKFQNSNEELSGDSKVAITQLSGGLTAVRDELSKTNSSFRVISLTVDDINQRVSTLGIELKDARVLKDISDLKIAIYKLWDQIVATDSTNRLGVIEKAIADVINRMITIEKAASIPAKRNASEVQSVSRDRAPINDEIFKDRLVHVELLLATMTSATIDSLATERELHKVEVDLLKSRLDASEKKQAELEIKIKAFTTLLPPEPAADASEVIPVEVVAPVVNPIVMQVPVQIPVGQLAHQPMLFGTKLP